MVLKDVYESFEEDFRNPEFIRAYLNNAMADPDPRLFLHAVKNVMRANNLTDGAEAHGGDFPLDDSAETRGRGSLDGSLHNGSSPEFIAMTLIMRQLGLRFTVTSI